MRSEGRLLESDDVLIAAFAEHGEGEAGADALGVPHRIYKQRLYELARRGRLGTKPVLPGFGIGKATTVLGPDGEVEREFIQQRPAASEPYSMPEGFVLKRDSALVDGQGNRVGGWRISEPTRERLLEQMRAAVAGFRDEIPRATSIPAPSHSNDDLLSLYVCTDHHLGALAWDEETGGGDYDLSIGETLLKDWFSMAVKLSPPSRKAVFAQLGDLLHYDGFKSITPEHGNLLDADTRYPKMVRSAIRVLRHIIALLLEKHEEVEILMCDANHDPAGEVWLREMFAAFLENEPRAKVQTAPGTYSVVEHGDVSLFFHHGHRRKVGEVDSVFAGKFREVYGRTRYSYAHLGHRHSDELKSTPLMKVEQHETLAAPDAFAANGGWLSGRSAKVITYHKLRGEVGRLILTPEMVAGASNSQQRAA
ncbi:MAG: oxidoreductase [Devosia sp.]|nr:oxidoreductase [Devosia sp.]